MWAIEHGFESCMLSFISNVCLKYVPNMQGRIQEFILEGAKPRSPMESWGRSPNRGREAPEYRGRSPSRGREAPENWGRSPNRGRSPRKSGGGAGEGARWAPPQKICEKSNLEPFILVHIWCNYLKWLTKWFNCHFHEKSLVIIQCDGKSGGRGLGEGTRWATLQQIFEKSNLKPFILVQIWSNYLKWLNKWFNCHYHEKTLVIIWCDGIIKFGWSIKFDRGSGDEVPQKQKLFSY